MDSLTLESLFPHSHVSADPSRERGIPGRTGSSDGGVLPSPVEVLEHVPLLSFGLQAFHGFFGNQTALERARQADPIGPNGFITHAAEHVPIVNSVVQAVHKAGDADEALQRARERDPIGSHGYLTKVFEHIPIVSDGMVAIHRYHGEDLAAERARGYSLARLLSKDGAITRMAELVPGTNVVAALAHSMNGDRERVERALNLGESWSSVSNPNSGLWQVAELVPGADAFAFAVHLQSGHYAQALRSVTKTSWVNVKTTEITFYIHCSAACEIWCEEVEILQVDVLPRQLSLVVGLSDLVTNFLQVDREGHRRPIKDPEALREAQNMTAMDLTKELLKEIVDEKIVLRVNYLISMVPTYVDWLVEYLGDDLLPRYRKESLAWQLFAPARLPAASPEEKEELRQSCPTLSVRFRPLDAPDPIRLRPRGCASPASCLSLAALAAACGLGTKVGAVAGCFAGLAGAMELGRTAVRYAIDCVSADNERRWKTAMVDPQPEQSVGSGAASLSSLPGAGESSPAAEAAGTSSSSRGLVIEIPRAEVDRLNPFACDYVRRSVCPAQDGSCFCWCLQPLARRWLLSRVAEAVEDPLPLVLAADLDPWEAPLEGYSFDLKMPSMRFALVLHVDMSNANARFVRAFAAFPEELTSNVVRCLQAQIREWDLREMDPRFASFTAPAHVDFEPDVSWSTPSLLRVTARNVSSRLDLPAA